MAETAGPMDETQPPFGVFALDGSPMDHYMDGPDIPWDDKGEACLDHMREGRFGEMLDEFWLTGCHFPAEDKPQMVRTKFVCPGPGVLKHCRLTLRQLDKDGEVINEGHLDSTGHELPQNGEPTPRTRRSIGRTLLGRITRTGRH